LFESLVLLLTREPTGLIDLHLVEQPLVPLAVRLQILYLLLLHVLLYSPVIVLELVLHVLVKCTVSLEGHVQLARLAGHVEIRGPPQTLDVGSILTLEDTDPQHTQNDISDEQHLQDRADHVPLCCHRL